MRMVTDEKIELLGGQISYNSDWTEVSLLLPDGPHLMVMDKPPYHHFDPSDVAAAARYYQMCGVPADANTSLYGMHFQLGMRRCILVSRVISVG